MGLRLCGRHFDSRSLKENEKEKKIKESQIPRPCSIIELGCGIIRLSGQVSINLMLQMFFFCFYRLRSQLCRKWVFHHYTFTLKCLCCELYHKKKHILFKYINFILTSSLTLTYNFNAYKTIPKLYYSSPFFIVSVDNFNQESNSHQAYQI